MKNIFSDLWKETVSTKEPQKQKEESIVKEVESMSSEEIDQLLDEEL